VETPAKALETTGPGESQVYHNPRYRFALSYPADWIAIGAGERSATLVPAAQVNWEPASPGDDAHDPAVRIDCGAYIRERIGPARFPEQVDATLLRAWIDGEYGGIQGGNVEAMAIDGQDAFVIKSTGEFGCAKVVYWRPLDLERLVRLSTGCASPYLDQFDRIVESLHQE
jgi:hypothetical protein